MFVKFIFHMSIQIFVNLTQDEIRK